MVCQGPKATSGNPVGAVTAYSFSEENEFSPEQAIAGLLSIVHSHQKGPKGERVASLTVEMTYFKSSELSLYICMCRRVCTYMQILGVDIC